MTIVRIGVLRALANNAWNTVITKKRSLKMNALDIFFRESRTGSFHPNMAKTPMPEHRVPFDVRKRRFRRFQSRSR
jgi:hypothetical protein